MHKPCKDYTIETLNGKILHLNVCQSVKTETFGLKDDVEASDVAGFIRRAHGDFAIGKVNTSFTVFESRPRFVLTDGSRCKAKAGGQPGDVRASSVIEFVCDSSVPGPGRPRLFAQLPPGDDEIGCAFVIEWKTQYACATSEGGWGFFGILAVTFVVHCLGKDLLTYGTQFIRFLVLLMTYTVLGTLYNRFVLELRGFDQIPQFSIESMRYHGREAWDWIRDIVSGLDIEGRGNNAGGGSYGGLPSEGLQSGGIRSATNPVSHHTQVSGLASDELEDAGRSFGGGGGGFIRSQPGQHRVSPFQRADTNTISHQTQVNAAQSLSFSASSPPPQSRPQSQSSRDTPREGRLVPESRGATQEERDFMLGDDDEDAEELGDITAPPPHRPTLVSPPLPAAAPTNIPSNATSAAPDTAASARGRDLGGGDVTLL
ncbi:hypothetical protein B0H34DRAFT_669710 [Crassisporium funariophilum]|nr:hypothetical protein B0H34DRAFT_669710 [Crassisporium funariophilum]